MVIDELVDSKVKSDLYDLWVMGWKLLEKY